ncbi:Protein kinase, ATP binding site [Phytophthora cactorum]|nr:Protein kinase, ATP binding site [Phytophthora cactorum]
MSQRANEHTECSLPTPSWQAATATLDALAGSNAADAQTTHSNHPPKLGLVRARARKESHRAHPICNPAETPVSSSNSPSPTASRRQPHLPPPAPAPAPLGRKNSADDLVAELASSPPVHTPSDARLLYREWRTGSHDVLSRSPFGVYGRSPNSLPRIAERLENLPLRANAPPAAHVAPQDVDARARLLSQKIAAMDASQSGAAAAAAAVKPQSGSYGSVGSSEPLQLPGPGRPGKEGYFPVAPKPSALGVQRGLKDSVVNDMCRAVVKHMVGDVYVSASGSYGQRKVLNHLYEPVFASVQAHFRRLPARYALSVNPDDVPLHMRLLAQNQRDPTAIAVNAQLKKDDNGEIVPNVCEVVVVSLDRENILDAITRALTTMKGNILDADVMTTSDGTLLDRFVVKGSFMSEERQEELRTNIEQNLRRLSMEEDTRPSATSTQDSGVKENVSLAEKLGVLQMVDKNEIKAEWKLDLNEVRLEKAVGSGRSGSTYSAWWRGTHVAAKVVDSSTNTQAVVFEFMENGTLTDLIRGRRGPIDFFRLVAEMAMGMNYLHLCSIMHRDLKSGNVLIDSHGTAKISDFGLSCVLEIGSSSDLTAETGTYRWMAPEVIRHEPYSSKADVYSFGIVLWELLARDQPFRGLTPIQANASSAARQTPQKIGELIEHCWHHDPARRPDFGAILEALPLCFGCAVLTQLIAVGCLLAIIPAAYLSYDYYLKPWAEDHYDEAVAAAKTVASRAASAAADIDTSELSCGDCLGVNLEYPISGLNSDYSSFQISLMNDAGKFLSAVTSSGVAIAGIAVFGSTLVGVLASASAMPSTNSGLFELTLMIAQGQFITLLGSINLEGVPGFFIEFCTKFAWTNLHIFPTSTTTKTTDATTARQRQLSSGGTDSSLGGVTRYAKTLGVDPDYLFYYTLMVLLAVVRVGGTSLPYLLLVLRIFKKEDRPLAQMLNNRVVWVSIQLSLLLQYSLAMTSCFQISYSVRNNRSTGGLILAAIILTTSCLGLAVFGICILSRYKHELVDHGTEGHEKKPFNHRYGSFYQDFTKENRFFFLAKMALDTHVQLGLLVAFNTIFIIAMVVRRPYLLRVFYVIGLLTSYLRIVMLLLTLVLVSSELVPQRIRDLISQIIICVNSLVLLCLFARVGYAAAKAMTKWLQNRKEAQAGANESDDSADLLPVEILENGGQRHVSLHDSHNHRLPTARRRARRRITKRPTGLPLVIGKSRDATIGTLYMRLVDRTKAPLNSRIESNREYTQYACAILTTLL